MAHTIIFPYFRILSSVLILETLPDSRPWCLCLLPLSYLHWSPCDLWPFSRVSCQNKLQGGTPLLGPRLQWPARAPAICALTLSWPYWLTCLPMVSQPCTGSWFPALSCSDVSRQRHLYLHNPWLSSLSLLPRVLPAQMSLSTSLPSSPSLRQSYYVVQAGPPGTCNPPASAA